MNDDVEIQVIEVGGPDTPLAILFQRLPTGQLAADVKGRMDPKELVDQLRFLADHIEGL